MIFAFNTHGSGTVLQTINNVNDVIDQLTCSSNSGQIFILELPSSIKKVKDILELKESCRHILIAVSSPDGFIMNPPHDNTVSPGSKGVFISNERPKLV